MQRPLVVVLAQGCQQRIKEHDMKVDAFKQLPVVSIGTGAKLGYVDDLLFETSPLRVAALRVKAEGQQIVVPWSMVKTIGPDAIMVPDDAAAHTTSSESSLSSLPDIAAIRKLKVVDEGGTFVGTVKEMDVDPNSGAITQVEAHEGGVLGIGGKTTTIAAADIRSIGDEVLVVTTPASAQDAANKKVQ
jgi:sporulation protein YlmC with PRC-barrel domain